MLDHYALVKALHITAVTLTGLVFLVRGALVQAGIEAGVLFEHPIDSQIGHA